MWPSINSSSSNSVITVSACCMVINNLWYSLILKTIEWVNEIYKTNISVVMMGNNVWRNIKALVFADMARDIHRFYSSEQRTTRKRKHKWEEKKLRPRSVLCSSTNTKLLRSILSAHHHPYVYGKHFWSGLFFVTRIACRVWLWNNLSPHETVVLVRK